MPDYSVHRPGFSGTSKTDWETPTRTDFDTDDLSAIAEHFLVSASGFDDPNRFEDLELPVVTPQGRLSLNGLWTARRGPYSVDHIEDIDDETKAKVSQLVNDLGRSNFEEFEDVELTWSDWVDETNESTGLVGGVLNDVISPPEPTYSPESAAIGLLFLICVSVVAEWSPQ